MKLNSYLLIGAILSFSLSGCLKTREDLNADASDSKPQQQQTTVQRQAAVKSAPPKVNQAQAIIAEAPAPRAEESDEQMRQLNGRIENLEHAQEESKKNQAELTKQVVKEELEQRLKAYEEELKVLQLKVQALIEVQEQKAAVTELKTKDPKALFDKGEEAFKEKRWKEAISFYQKYREAQPKGQYQTDATYKIGVCFQELNMKDEAKTFYEEVIQKYPKSREAKKAAIRLKSLK